MDNNLNKTNNNIFNSYGAFYFPKEFYQYKKESKETINNLDSLLKEIRIKIEELNLKVEGIEVDVDLEPLLERIGFLELSVAVLEAEGVEQAELLSFLDNTKLNASDYEEYKLFVESFKTSIENGVALNTQDIAEFKTKVNSDILLLENLIANLATKTELTTAITNLKEEIILLIPENENLTEVLERLNTLEYNLNITSTKQDSLSLTVSGLDSSLHDLIVSISKLDIEELRLTVATLLDEINSIKPVIESLKTVNDQLVSLSGRLDSIDLVLENLNITSLEDNISIINTSIEVLKLNDLFSYWINLPENMLLNSEGVLVINKSLSLKDFITYLLNEKDYSSDFSSIRNSILELNNTIQVLDNKVDSLDITYISQEITDIKAELLEITRLNDKFNSLTDELEQTKLTINNRIDTVVEDINSISDIVGSLLTNFYSKEEVDLLILPINSEITELTNKFLEYYTNAEIDILLQSIRDSIIGSEGVSQESLDIQLQPINEKLGSLETLIENIDSIDLQPINERIDRLQTELTTQKQNTYTKKQVDDLIAFYIGTGDGNYILRPATDLLLGGVKVGSGLTYLEDGTISVEFPEVEEYVLPEATETVLGGIRIGGGLKKVGDKIEVDFPIIEEYVLPEATETVLGGIRIGGGLKKVGGKLAVDVESLDIPSSYELPKATTETIGGIIVGDTLEVDVNGKIEVKPSAVSELPIATTETIGGIKVGENLTITEDGVLSATGGGGGTGGIPLATFYTVGGIRLSQEFALDSQGRLKKASMYDIALPVQEGTTKITDIDSTVNYKYDLTNYTNGYSHVAFNNKYNVVTDSSKASDLRLNYNNSWSVDNLNTKLKVEKANEVQGDLTIRDSAVKDINTNLSISRESSGVFNKTYESEDYITTNNTGRYTNNLISNNGEIVFDTRTTNSSLGKRDIRITNTSKGAITLKNNSDYNIDVENTGFGIFKKDNSKINFSKKVDAVGSTEFINSGKYIIISNKGTVNGIDISNSGSEVLTTNTANGLNIHTKNKASGKYVITENITKQVQETNTLTEGAVYTFRNSSTSNLATIRYSYFTNGIVQENYKNYNNSAVGKKEINGNVDILGDLNVTGAKNAIVPTRKGMLQTPAYETMGSYLGDIQEVEVLEGENIINLNELFLDSTEEGTKYHVFLTAYSDAHVYVSNRNNDSFTIISDKPTNISYEIKRRRKGFTKDYNLTEHTFEQMKEIYPTESDLLEQYQEYLEAEQERLREEQATLEEPVIEDIQ